MSPVRQPDSFRADLMATQGKGPHITVEHPDGRISTIPVVVIDGELFADIPAGCRIPGLVFPTPPLDATDQAQRNAEIRGIIDDLPSDHIDVEQVHRDLSAQQRRSATVDALSRDQILVVLKHEADKFASMLRNPRDDRGNRLWMEQHLLDQIAEIRRVTVMLMGPTA